MKGAKLFGRQLATKIPKKHENLGPAKQTGSSGKEAAPNHLKGLRVPSKVEFDEACSKGAKVGGVAGAVCEQKALNWEVEGVLAEKERQEIEERDGSKKNDTATLGVRR
jgi:hypothetical protein